MGTLLMEHLCKAKNVQMVLAVGGFMIVAQAVVVTNRVLDRLIENSPLWGCGF